jgi:hypothetical protein
MEKSPYKEDRLWSGADNIPAAFEASGEPHDMSLVSYLNSFGRVVVKNDPALIKVFGEDVVAEYERLLAKAE